MSAAAKASPGATTTLTGSPPKPSRRQPTTSSSLRPARAQETRQKNNESSTIQGSDSRVRSPIFPLDWQAASASPLTIFSSHASCRPPTRLGSSRARATTWAAAPCAAPAYHCCTLDVPLGTDVFRQRSRNTDGLFRGTNLIWVGTSAHGNFLANSKE